MNFNYEGAGAWLSGTGVETDIVMSTRLRLARNVEGFPFKGRLTDEEATQLESFLASRVVDERVHDSLRYVKLHELEEVDRLVLLENHLISMEHYKGAGPRGVAYDSSGSVAIMVNEEDHFRIQLILSGLALEEGLERIYAIDDALSSRFKFAFSPQLGYLTSCPTNVGTGLRVSVMLHLPALVLSKHIEKVFNAVSQVNLAVRGFFGEGSHAVGDFYQISNQVTLGVTPEEIVKTLVKVLPKIIGYEREVRRAMQKDGRKILEDRVWRALGTLRSARTISSEETLTYLSSVRLGTTMEILNEVPIQMVNQLFLDVQPGHLQKIEGKTLSAEHRDISRANLIRSRLQKDPPS